jgi:hypothetical protein
MLTNAVLAIVFASNMTALPITGFLADAVA